MPDLHKALADIDVIRTQVARGTEFRGYGPAPVALTGLLALLASGIQALALDHPREQVGGYLAIWVGTAILSVALIGAETITRPRRLHSGLADEMLHAALDNLPRAAPSRCCGGPADPVRVGAFCPRKLVDAAGPLADPIQSGHLRLLPAAAEGAIRGRCVVSCVRAGLPCR